MRIKFVVTSVSANGITLGPIAGENKENKHFFKGKKPSGVINLPLDINDDTEPGQKPEFVVGNELYIDFVPARRVDIPKKSAE